MPFFEVFLLVVWATYPGPGFTHMVISCLLPPANLSIYDYYCDIRMGSNGFYQEARIFFSAGALIPYFWLLSLDRI